MQNEEQVAPPRPPVQISAGTRHPWILGPLYKLVKSKDGLRPEITDPTVIRLGAKGDKANPGGDVIDDFDGDTWHKFMTNKYVGPVIQALLDNREIHVYGYTA